MSSHDRAPVMAPAPAASRGREVVRRRRLVVDDGALVLHTEDGGREVLGQPGEVVSATWVPDVADRPEALVLETLELGLRDGRTLSLPLDDWFCADNRAVPRQSGGSALRPLDASGSTALRVSGAAAVAQALGANVVTGKALTADARQIDARGRVPGFAQVLLRAWIVPGLLALALAVVGRGGSLLVWLVVVLGLGFLVSLATSLALDISADRQLRRADLPTPPWRPAPTTPAHRAHARVALASPGRDWLVVRDEAGRETWTPGPALGGARTARVRGSWLAFEDETGTALQRLWWPWWGDGLQLEARLEELAALGYVVERDAEDPTGPLWRPPPRAGAHVVRSRDGDGGTPFPAASCAPIVAFLLVDLAGEELLDPSVLAPIVPALLACLLALVVLARWVSRLGDYRLRPAAELSKHPRDRSAPNG